MAISDVLVRIRKEQGLTQDDLARKLFVTRQAVSRWERGETSPGIDMCKLIAATCDVPVMLLLEMPDGDFCQSCGMPLASPDLLGTEADGSPSERFCKWCYENGSYQGACTMEDMVDICVEHMATPDAPFSPEEARAYMETLLPTLERWQGAAPDETR